MKPKIILAALAAAAVILGGCGGRAAERVSIVQEGDEQMTCEERSVAIKEAAEQYELKQRESDEEEEHNIDMLALSFIPFVGLAAAANTDAKRGAFKEAVALRDRIDRLERIQDRKCGDN